MSNDDQVRMFPLKGYEKGGIEGREERLVRFTVTRLCVLTHALEAAVKYNEAILKKMKSAGDSEAVQGVYRNIIKSYEAELQYIHEIKWQYREEVENKTEVERE